MASRRLTGNSSRKEQHNDRHNEKARSPRNCSRMMEPASSRQAVDSRQDQRVGYGLIPQPLDPLHGGRDASASEYHYANVQLGRITRSYGRSVGTYFGQNIKSSPTRTRTRRWKRETLRSLRQPNAGQQPTKSSTSRGTRFADVPASTKHSPRRDRHNG